MKKIILYSVLLTALLTGCNDGFMDRFPETSISPEAFFKTTADLELYTNTYYEYIKTVQNRNGMGLGSNMNLSDDYAVFSTSGNSLMNLLRGVVTPATVDGWNNWGELRRFNFLLDHVNSVSGQQDVIDHHVGVTRLMRANWYYNMVKRYSNVPWYSTPLSDADEELLYKKQDSRTLVVDNIMEDLDFAVKHVSANMGNKSVINKWYAYACMAQICLHEGTFRKYHDELSLQSTANAYLQQARDAAQAIMNSGLFSIDMSGGTTSAYRNLFTNENLSASPEIILMLDFDNAANLTHGIIYSVHDRTYGLSRSLMESYQVLTPEGEAVPFTSIAGYDKKSFTEVFENRDPRFRQTFMYPGFIRTDQTRAYRANLNYGGYPQIKYFPQTPAHTNERCYTDLPVSRLAEILLIYAEAKAELGELTQTDLDLTVNKIRARVGMPPTLLGNIPPDAGMTGEFPNVTGANRNVILEIRRERRVELACENLRTDDLFRWKAGYLLQRRQQGIYISGFGLQDFIGNGVPEMGIFESISSNTVPEEERGNYTFYYLMDSSGAPTGIYLSDGSSGYIMSTNDRDMNREFKEPQYYYYPVPQSQRILNPNLDETNFW